MKTDAMGKVTDEMARQEWEKIYSRPGWSHKNHYPNDDIIRFVMRTFSRKVPEDVSILDLGCGWGNNLRFLLDEGFKVCGLDISETACRQCFSITPCVVLGKMYPLPFADNSFEAAIDRNAIQCNSLSDIFHIVQEVHRILKPGGMLYSIILFQTNQPHFFHAKYLNTPDSKLSRKLVETIYAPFSFLEIDSEIRTYNDGGLALKQWHIAAKKDGKTARS